ncbi:hypothetical protein H261_03733 [Paramagnetospirillum caucaseum]|uniref:Coenzyme PQQ synthesis protein D (PqqD) n=1 Tax=Paramagnetospirillum caucaseum TaxID=1244869 RepID=M2ZA54_9PROT|nr:PqqD family protein [Paramagnetospirillum caucaseum]EME71275.1 hypothetical protein H261_03733 [Paramagnetospirillum caucaseum]
MPLCATSVIAQTDGLQSTTVGDEIVILNLASNNYIGLNDVGRRIWSILESPHRVDDLIKLLTEAFRGDPEVIAAEVMTFITELERDGIIHVVED